MNFTWTSCEIKLSNIIIFQGHWDLSNLSFEEDDVMDVTYWKLVIKIIIN